MITIIESESGYTRVAQDGILRVVITLTEHDARGWHRHRLEQLKLAGRLIEEAFAHFDRPIEQIPK